MKNNFSEEEKRALQSLASVCVEHYDCSKCPFEKACDLCDFTLLEFANLLLECIEKTEKGSEEE